MIKGIGTDIVEVDRIRRSITKNQGFLELVFAKAEIESGEKKGIPSYAGKFAAKEAFLKALGTGWSGAIALNEVVIVNDDLGKPHIILQGQTKAKLSTFAHDTFHVSISHTEKYATATVLIESSK